MGGLIIKWDLVDASRTSCVTARSEHRGTGKQGNRMAAWGHVREDGVKVSVRRRDLAGGFVVGQAVFRKEKGQVWGEQIISQSSTE